MAEIPGRSLHFLAIGAVVVLLSAPGTPADDVPARRWNAAPTEASVERGARLYRDNCASCHGEQAYGNPASVIPALAGQRGIYLLKQLVAFTDAQRDSPEMHRRMAAEALESPWIWRDLTVYLSTLPANEHPQAGGGSLLDQGRRVYQQFCVECHGRRGEGRATGAVPAVRGQHYAYLARQLQAFASLHRDDMELPVLEKIARLPQEQIEGVADYASRLPVKE